MMLTGDSASRDGFQYSINLDAKRISKNAAQQSKIGLKPILYHANSSVFIDNNARNNGAPVVLYTLFGVFGGIFYGTYYK